ncbi:hypothetical protein ACWEOZ_13910 [Actinoplanes sp. NPDC004185]
MRPGEAARLGGTAEATRLSSAGTAARPIRAAEMTGRAGVIRGAGLTGTAGLTRMARLPQTARLTGTAGLTRMAGLPRTAGLTGTTGLTGTAGLTRMTGLPRTARLTGTAGLTRMAGLPRTAGLVQSAGQAAGQAGAGETVSRAARCRAARADRQPARFGGAHRAGVATRTGRGVRLARPAVAGCGAARAANDTGAVLAALHRAGEGPGTARLTGTRRLPGSAGEAAGLLVGGDTAAR